ncbi:hypothetical protein [Biostraticola tofi]|uniref:Uncharacterized protein n=1 Tax=Biostraticola tofi TaxID=466109 RepID=A0A4R3Z3N3_9GAMM|nr:hypothetical protein [Biostraticola tofi]TCW00432.1 hypothetical protein EDC52_101782 [Biostraticola tofi]
MTETIKVTFADRGQDFIAWYIRNKKVIDCQPFQGSVWVGTRIIGRPIVGKRLAIITRDGCMGQLGYPVECIETLSVDETDKVETYYQGWLEIINRRSKQPRATS